MYNGASFSYMNAGVARISKTVRETTRVGVNRHLDWHVHVQFVRKVPIHCTGLTYWHVWQMSQYPRLQGGRALKAKLNTLCSVNAGIVPDAGPLPILHSLAGSVIHVHVASTRRPNLCVHFIIGPCLPWVARYWVPFNKIEKFIAKPFYIVGKE